MNPRIDPSAAICAVAVAACANTRRLRVEASHRDVIQPPGKREGPGAFHDRRLEIGERSQASFARRFLEREVEIQQHEDAGLGVDADGRTGTAPGR
jgi:hypothetical protein